MNDVLKEALADAGVEIPSDAKLKSIGDLVTQQLHLEAEVERLTNELKQANLDLEKISTRTLPEALLDLGVTHFETPKVKIKLEKVYFASYTKEKADEFFTWVEEQGDGGIITTKVTVDFGKGLREEAKEFLEWLHKQNVPHASEAVLTGDIHWATLRAYARDKVEDKVDLPPVFKVHPVDRAKLTLKGE